MALTNKLTAIADAIRDKNGTTELMKLDDMPTAIAAIETGGGGAEIPDEFFEVTSDCNYKFGGNTLNYLLETEPFASRWHSNSISKLDYMFYYSTKLKTIPFALNCRSDMTSFSAKYVFTDLRELLELPDFNATFKPTELTSFLNSCYKVRNIPDSWIEYFDMSLINARSSIKLSNLCDRFYSLRSFPAELLKTFYVNRTSSLSSSYALYYYLFNMCSVLDEVTGIPVYGTATSNCFTSFCSQCHRVKNIVFETNEDGTAKTAQWKAQTIDLSGNYFGYATGNVAIIQYNSGITKDKEVKDDATYQALKNDPDWFTSNVSYSRYNHDSAVATINSLPDTSAYLATAGGTNTIKFKGAAGSLTDGGAINTLTEEEIAVATAKGWTVTLT